MVANNDNIRKAAKLLSDQNRTKQFREEMSLRANAFTGISKAHYLHLLTGNLYNYVLTSRDQKINMVLAQY